MSRALRKYLCIVSTLILLTGGVEIAQAVAPPNIITYQGRALNTNGVPVSNSSLSMSFALYTASSGGTCLWSNDSANCYNNTPASIVARTVSLTTGLFTENLGDTSNSYAAIADSVFADNSTVYLQVTIAGETLSPRRRITAAPYALNAQTLDGIDSATLQLFETGSGRTFEDDAPTIIGANTAFSYGSGGVGDLRVADEIEVLGDGYIDDDLVVGAVTSSTETIANVAFSLSGDDLFVAGSLGVEAAVYMDGTLSVVGTTTVGDLSCTNCLDFTEFADTLSLDASTSIAQDGAETFTISNGSTGNTIINLTSSGDFVLQDGGVSVVTFTDAGLLTLAAQAPTDASNFLSVTNTGAANSFDLLDITLTVGASDAAADTARAAALTFPTPAEAGDTVVGLSLVGATATAGTEVALDVGAITAGAGTETAIRIGSGWDTVLDSGALDISGAGVITGATGLTSSGTITLSGLTASRLVTTDASSNLSNTITSANTAASVSDETGSGLLVFGTSSTLTTSLLTDSTTFSLVNTTATTVNFAGAATTISMGASTGTTTINNALTVTGALTANNTFTNTNGTTSNSVINLTSSGDFVLQDGGVSVVTFTDAGLLTLAAQAPTDASNFLSVTNTAGSGVSHDLLDISLTSPTDDAGAADTARAIALTLASPVAGDTIVGLAVVGATASAGTEVALDVPAITAGAGTETAIRIGSGWDTVLDSGALDISGAGVISGATGLTSSGTITLSGLTTNGPVYTSTGGVLNTEAQLSVSRGGTGNSTFTTNGALYGNGTGAIQSTAAGGAGTLCLVSTNGGAPTFASCAGSGGTSWSTLSNPSANTSINHGEFTSVFTWDTATTAAALDAWTIEITNDATTDTTTQRLLVLENNDAAGSTATERLLVLNNADTTEAVTTALEITSAAGGITTGIDVSGSNITTALSIGANTISGTTATIDFTDFDISADGLITLAPDSGLDADLNYLDIQTPALTATAATTIDVYGISSAGSLTTTADGSAETLTYRGIGLTLPAITTAEAGDTTALTGILISAGTVTDGAGTETSTGLDVSDADLDNALTVGANDIEGTTATITFTDFTVAADGNVSLLPDSAGDALTITTAAGAIEAISIDAATSANTDTDGLIDIDAASITTSFEGMNLALTANSGLAADAEITGALFTLTNADADGEMVGIDILAADAAGNAADMYTAAIRIDSAETTASNMTDAILITSSGVAAGVVDAIDASATNITNAINVGDNVVLGTTATIDFTNFDVTTGGAITIAGDIAVNGDDITSDGDLTIDATGGQLLLADTDVFNIGGVSALAYNALSNSGGSAGAAAVAADNDLYIQGDLEIDGTTTFDGAMTFNAALTSNTDVNFVFATGGADTENFDIDSTHASDVSLSVIDVTFTDSAGASTGTNYLLSLVNANETGTTGTPDALIFMNQADANETVADGLLIQLATGGTLTDAIDVSDTDITNAINVGDNVILGTTPTIDFTNFDVSSGGAITVAAGVGLDTNAAGALALGNTNATSVSICNSAACDTLTLGSNADADTITIGDAASDTTTLNGTTVAIDSGDWDITTVGVVTGIDDLTVTAPAPAEGENIIAVTNTASTSAAFDVMDISVTMPSDGDAGAADIIQAISLTLAAAANGDTGRGVNIAPPATSTAGGTLNAINIGTITTSNGTDNAIAFGTGWDTLFSGTTAGTNLFDFTNFDVTTGGAITIAGDIAVNGDDITSDGDLTIDATGGQLLLADTDVFNIGGVSALAYNALSNSGGSAGAAAVAADNDLYIQGDLEIDGTTTFDGAMTFNAALTSNTDVNFVFATGGADTENFDIDSTHASDVSLSVIDVTFTDSAGASTGTNYVLSLVNADDGAATGEPDAILFVNNADTNETIANGLEIRTSAGITDAIDVADGDIINAINVGDNVVLGTTATIDLTDFDVSADGLIALAPDSGGTGITITPSAALTTGLDVSNANITNGVSLGATILLGTTATIDFTNFDVAGATGNITTVGDLAVNGDDITSDGDLTIDATGGQILLADTDVFNIGGVSALAYNALSNSGGAAGAAAVAADNDLYIQGDLEIDGTSTFDGTVTVNSTITVTDLACTDCLDFPEFIDSMTLDAATTITADNAGEDFTLTLTGGGSDLIVNSNSTDTNIDFNLASAGLFRIRDTSGSTVNVFTVNGDETIDINAPDPNAAGGNLEIDFIGVTTGIGVDINVDTLTTGTGLRLYTSGAFSSGNLMALDFTETYTGASPTLSGQMFNLDQTLTYNNASGTFTISGAAATIDRSITNSAAGTTNITGAVLALVDTGTQSAGTLTHSGNVLELTQNYAASTGNTLDINGTKSAGDAVDIALTLGNDADVDTVTGLQINVTSAATADADLLRALDIPALTSADGTVVETAIAIGGSWDDAININSSTFIAETSGALAIAPNTTGTFLDFALETEWTTGTLINADFASATTQSGAMTGLLIDLGTNLTGANAADQTGLDIELVGGTFTGAGAETFRGYVIDADSALVQNTAAGSIFWRGGTIVMPNITQTLGTVDVEGMTLTNGTITTGGTQQIIFINAQGVAAGTLRGIDIQGITPGGGTETGLAIGGGWDDAINVNTDQFVVEVTGVTTVGLDDTETIAGLCHSGGDVDVATNTSRNIVACSSAPDDYAEWYETEANVDHADVVALSSQTITYIAAVANPFTGEVTQNATTKTLPVLRKATASDGSGIFGIVSTSPVQTIGSDLKRQGKHPMPIALAGRVPLKVTDENGPIAPGDYLTASSTPGFAMKATTPSQVIAMALGPHPSGQGMIQAIVRNFWWMGDVLNEDGSSDIVTNTVVVSPLKEATTDEPSVDSFGLALRGSVWNGREATAVEMMLQNTVEDSGQYRLSVRNTAETEVAYITSEGTMRIAGDMVIGGRLYPSDRGVPQTEKYIYYDGSEGEAGEFIRTNAKGWATDSYDFAEMFTSTESLTAGDVVVFAESSGDVQRATSVADERIAGIVSTRPGFLAGENRDGAYPIALSGRVPTKVNIENGAIAVGDPLTASTVAGVATKAAQAGQIVGYALEAYTGDESDNLILVYVNVGYWSDDATIYSLADNRASELSSFGATSFTTLNMSGNIYMTAYEILAIGRLEGIHSIWSIESDGTIKTEGLVKTVIDSYQNTKVETIAVTSPEALITLTGSATLVNGMAEVRFENVVPEYNDVISAIAPIRVIVTPTGPVSLYVSEKDQNHFIVQRFAGSDDVEFDWMVTGYRKGYEPEEVEEVEKVEEVEEVAEVEGTVELASPESPDEILIDSPTEPDQVLPEMTQGDGGVSVEQPPLSEESNP